MPPLLPARLTQQILTYLGVAQAEPDLSFLDLLIEGYGQRVPWESASRIARSAQTINPPTMPRWAEEFWDDALSLGTGGTCFESNWAFFALLRSLGYTGYLTINNMHASIGCHTAIIIHLVGSAWVVDAGYPIYAAVPLDPQQATERATPFMTYQALPTSAGGYQLICAPHPKPYLFDLIDRPVDDPTYQLATTADYGQAGLFLQQVIINKLVDGALWRFNSADQPYHLQRFDGGVRTDHALEGDVAAQLSVHFAIAASVVMRALAHLARSAPPL